VVADALSRLDTEMSHSILISDAIPELFKNSDDKSLNIDYPLSTAVIAKHQQDTTLVRHIKCHPEYFTKRVDGHNVIFLNNKIYIPKTLRKEILKWYHTTLHHPGIVRTEKSIKSHLTWPGVRTDIEQYIQKLRICQLRKNPRKKYGYLSKQDIDPRKKYGYSSKQDINQDPWHTICVYTIGPYSVTTKHDKELNLLAITICDPATSWFEVAEIKIRMRQKRLKF
jgi:hypothetical protein